MRCLGEKGIGEAEAGQGVHYAKGGLPEDVDATLTVVGDVTVAAVFLGEAELLGVGDAAVEATLYRHVVAELGAFAVDCEQCRRESFDSERRHTAAAAGVDQLLGVGRSPPHGLFIRRKVAADIKSAEAVAHSRIDEYRAVVKLGNVGFV